MMPIEGRKGRPETGRKRHGNLIEARPKAGIVGRSAPCNLPLHTGKAPRMNASSSRPPEPCPQCGLLMGHEIAVLVGQHITCPPITPENARKAQAVETLLTVTGQRCRRTGLSAWRSGGREFGD